MKAYEHLVEARHEHYRETAVAARVAYHADKNTWRSYIRQNAPKSKTKRQKPMSVKQAKAFAKVVNKHRGK